jgi:serralysin
LASLCPAGANASSWYVDGARGSYVGKGTPASPFLTIDQGWQAAKPGDTIYLAPTVSYSVQYLMHKSGAAGKYITLTGTGQAPNLTRILGRNSAGANIALALIDDSYVTVSNLQIDGEYAAGDPQTLECVSVQHSNHINILGNRISHCGGNGIASVWSDYLNIAHNIVSASAMNTVSYRGSGISTYEDADADGNHGVKIVIADNIIYGNSNTPVAPCAAFACSNDTDGSGIILDESKRLQQPGSTVPPYRGQTLVANNLIYGNGGRGITAYGTVNDIIENNTIFDNNLDPYERSANPGEISIIGTGNVRVYNNLLYSNGGAGPEGTGQHYGISVQGVTDGLGPVVIDYNLSFNPQAEPGLARYVRGNTNPVTFGTHELFGKPLFVNPPQDFHLRPGSPGRSAADAAMAPASDIDGVARHGADIGAYQH